MSGTKDEERARLEKMVALSKKYPLGTPVTYKGLDTEIVALSDENFFLKVADVSISPEEIEGETKSAVVRDREIEGLRRQIHDLNHQIEHMLQDQDYYRYRREEESSYRRDRDRSYRDMQDGMRLMMSPNYTGIYGGGEFTSRVDVPQRKIYIDPLNGKEPTQRKRK